MFTSECAAQCPLLGEHVDGARHISQYYPHMRTAGPFEQPSTRARILAAVQLKVGQVEAVLETSVERTAQFTAETLLIRIGQRTIRMTRQQTHVAPRPPLDQLSAFVEVEECLFKPGWTLKTKR